MIGINSIASYIPENTSSNLEYLDKFSIDEKFLKEKVGVFEKKYASENQSASDLALKALENLINKTKIDEKDIDILVVVTQNPDSNIPHVSGILHHKANLKKNCLTFDISLGCSGYVYGLSVMKSVMEANSLENGILITADPYSKIVNPDDKNTFFLFGDAASATLLSIDYKYNLDSFAYGSLGDNVGGLVVKDSELSMNGREVFNFAIKEVPANILDLLKKQNLSISEVDYFIFHQGSKFIIDSLAKVLKIPHEKIANELSKTGNTVSSSIPLILESHLDKPYFERILLSGFGVGFSYASSIISKYG